MRRLTALLLVGLLGFVGTACDPQLSRKASGTFTGTTVYEFFTGGCDFIFQIYNATYVRRQGQEGGTFDIEGCLANSPPNFPFEGTFELTTHGGARLRGTVSGTGEAFNSPTFPFHYTVTVTDGTKRFSGASGTIQIEGVFPGGGPPGVPGHVEGTLFAVLQGPNGERIAL